MAASVILELVLLVFVVKTSVAQYSCQYRNHISRICIIENITGFNMHQIPNKVSLEFVRPQIPILDEEIFDQLTNTKHLEIRNGFVEEVWFSSPIMESLRLIHTNLTVLEALPERNYSLRHLKVRSSVFSRWSTSLEALKALEKIILSHCNFYYIDLEWFSGFKKLRVLDVSKNKLISVFSPPGLRLAALREFYVASNKLEVLRRFPDAFPKLKQISLEDNVWLCEWVTKAREANFRQRISSIGSDLPCEEGWQMNGGLCCRPGATAAEQEQQESDADVIIEVMVMDVNNTVMILDETLEYNVTKTESPQQGESL